MLTSAPLCRLVAQEGCGSILTKSSWLSGELATTQGPE